MTTGRGRRSKTRPKTDQFWKSLVTTLYVPTGTKSISENPRLFILVFNLTNAHDTCNTH